MPRVAAVQMAAIPMDVDAGLARIREFAREAAAEGAQLVVFPELLVPGYPRYVPDPFPSTPEGHDAWHDMQRYYKAYLAGSQVVPGPFTETLGEIARSASVDMVVGVSEKHPTRRGALWNTAVVVDKNGSYVGKHRKLVAVMHEKLYFQRGGREDLRLFDLGVGRVGVAICFENHHPLIRRSLGALGEEIHCALWTGPAPQEVAGRGGKIEAHRELGVAHALDTGSWVVIASQVTSQDPQGGALGSRWAHSGGSYIINPLGDTIAQVADYEEGIAIADIDLSLIDAGRLIWNPYGDDLREDVFGTMPSAAAPAGPPSERPPVPDGVEAAREHLLAE
jgi:nitrilase